MILELIVAFVGWIVVLWFTLKIIDDIKTRRMIRRYKEEDDPGRKGDAAKQTKWKPNGSGFRGSPGAGKGKPDVQKFVSDAKQELLQGGVGGIINDSIEPNSSTELNHRY